MTDPVCPGCGLENTRITDGVCQWCGHKTPPPSDKDKDET